MDHAAYYQAAVPEPHTILGLKLRPFSLGHLVLLHRVESAFVTGAVPDFSDLALSVFICSQTYADGVKSFDDPELPEFMRRWHDKLSGTGWLTEIGLRNAKAIDLNAKCLAFRDYIEAGSLHPDYSYKDDTNSKALDVPLVQIVKVRLMSEMGLSEAELMDRPWGLCLWDYLTLRAIDGTLEIVDADEMESAQRMAEQIAERIKAN